MNRVSQRQLLAIGGLLVGGLLVAWWNGMEPKVLIAVTVMWIGALFAILLTGADGGSGELIETIASSVRRMTDGRRPPARRDGDGHEANSLPPPALRDRLE